LKQNSWDVPGFPFPISFNVGNPTMNRSSLGDLGDGEKTAHLFDGVFGDGLLCGFTTLHYSKEKWGCPNIRSCGIYLR
jgi:hypothetical protein